ncbi:RipA family octameric membrane protein [Alistipes onderdonkii]|uniref:RipA family octameric membrane protein n=1 Tax=Alistipes onderdonkii TaxID=328813 RepID=UPI0018A8FA30|nr:hypothetical protein [Alistipes onderdonkii]
MDLLMDRYKKEKAFEKAHDIRKFEIELYWKRTTYFWAFIAASFAGYFAILTSKSISFQEQYLFLIESIGFVFSLGWFFVNRASKHWQLNWEKVIDSLEDDITGPLMKNHINNHNSFWSLTLSYRFSVSRINQIISCFITLIWFLLMILTSVDIICNCQFSLKGSWLYPLNLIVVVIFTTILCRGGQHDDNENVELKAFE